MKLKLNKINEIEIVPFCYEKKKNDKITYELHQSC